jgi:hypothetical protein
VQDHFEFKCRGKQTVVEEPVDGNGVNGSILSRDVALVDRLPEGCPHCGMQHLRQEVRLSYSGDLSSDR